VLLRGHRTVAVELLLAAQGAAQALAASMAVRRKAFTAWVVAALNGWRV
jgi:hypothetical protein